MVGLWAVKAQVEYRDSRTGFSGSKSLPTFYIRPTAGMSEKDSVMAAAEQVLTYWKEFLSDRYRVKIDVTVDTVDADTMQSWVGGTG
jgi:hypothetical protein